MQMRKGARKPVRSQRIQEIENFIIEKKSVSLECLCDHFQISMSTLRRDLSVILENGSIHKIYGGVTIQNPRRGLVAFEDRNIVNLRVKQRIARKAADFVNDGDIIFIDSGTTTLYMAEALSAKRDLTVLTNNLAFIFRAMEYETIRIISLSGTLDRKTCSFTGPDTVKLLENYNVSKAFMATTGFSIKNGVTNSSPAETDIKKKAISRSQYICLLADHSKFNAVSLMTYSHMESIHVLITDQTPPHELADYLVQCGVQTVLPESDAAEPEPPGNPSVF